MDVAHKNSLAILLASTTLTVMAGSIIAPVLNLMREGLRVDSASVGLIITTHGLFIALFSPLMGILIDRVGPKKPYVGGLILYGVAGGSGMFIESYWPLIVTRALLGIAVAAFFNAITVLVLNLYEGRARDQVMGWRGSSISVGGIIWPPIGGLLGGFSWHHPFAVYLLGIPLGFLGLIILPGIQKDRTPEEGKESTLLKVFRDKPELFSVYGLMFMANIFLYALIIFLPQRLEKIDIHAPFHISLFITASTISSGLTAFNYGRIKSKLSYRKIVLVTLALWSVGFTTISQTALRPLILVSLALFGIGQGLMLPTILSWVGELAPVSLRGRLSSYIGTSGFIGQFLSPILFAPVLILVGLGGIFLVVAAVCGALLLVLLLSRRVD